MRRLIATLTGVAAAVLIAPATATTANAQAKAATPLDALTQRLVKDHGIKVTSRYTLGWKGKTELDWRESGSVQLGPAGIVASDTTGRYVRYPDRKQAKEMAKPGRALALQNATYVSGPYYESCLPEGKTWIRYTGKHALVPGPSTLVDILDRRSYKALLATTSVKRPGGKVDGTATTLYTGSIAYGTVYKLSPVLQKMPGWKPNAALAKVKVGWKLWLGKDLLARRLITTFELKAGRDFSSWKNVVDTKYSSWGAKVSLTAPSASEVVDENDLGTDLPDSRDLTTMVPSMASPER
ncbi:hypothetical protein OG589_42845 [Sphaerisporangium sp. NBC_01403]|uniref:hypothetical protein n=1 Tax=Sphaerisporangium sp. NBC_01403 TaxID=2903599 RepID=UPI003250ADF1